MSFPETDADRLNTLKACGEEVAFFDAAGDTWNAYAIVDFPSDDDLDVMGNEVEIVCRHTDSFDDGDALQKPTNRVVKITATPSFHVAAIDFHVKEIREDGTGMVVLVCERA